MGLDMGVILSCLIPIRLPQFYFLSNGKFLAACKKLCMILIY